MFSDHTKCDMSLSFKTQPMHEEVVSCAETTTQNCEKDFSTNNCKFSEYITLNGNVIRSVMPPGSRANNNRMVDQGFVRPFVTPLATAPKIPISYPPTKSNASIGEQASTENACCSPNSAFKYQKIRADPVTSNNELAFVIEETVDELEHSETLFPPPSPISHARSMSYASGLHKPESIPKYQRNWTTLLTQSPVRTPEPSELRENVPLAFVDPLKPPCLVTNIPTQPGLKAGTELSIKTSKPEKLYSASAQSPKQKKTYDVHEVSENTSGPVTMAFQSLDEHLFEDDKNMKSDLNTAPLFNKVVPIIPFYQTPEKLCFDECPAQHARAYDRRSTSPFLLRAHSPAPGPPPNPLSIIRAPRIRETGVSRLSSGVLQTGSIITGQSYAGVQEAPQKENHILSYSEISSQMGSHCGNKVNDMSEELDTSGILPYKIEKQFLIDKQFRPEILCETKKEKGNAPEERHQVNTEKLNHIQKPNSAEISKSYGETSTFSDQQTCRKTSKGQRDLSIEKKQHSLQFQSEPIRERAASLSDSSFPQLRPPSSMSMFPPTSMLPYYDEPLRLSDPLPRGVVAPPNGFFKEPKIACGAAMKLKYEQENIKPLKNSSNTVGSSLVVEEPLTMLQQESKTNNSTADCFNFTKASLVTNAYAPNANSLDQIKEIESNSSIKNDSLGAGDKGGEFGATSAPKRGHGIYNKAVAPGGRIPLCNSCNIQIRGPFITALGRIWCPDHFTCVNANCRRPLQDIGFVEEKCDLYCEYCFEKYLAPCCSKCNGKIKGDCLNAIGQHFHPECFTCGHCGKMFGNTPFFVEDGNAYCEADWNELFTTKCFACGFPVEAGDKWVEALNHNYHIQCFNCTYCKQNLEGQSFYNKGGRPFCKNHAR